MRGMKDKLCHGGPRKPREPNGFLAPLLRAVAWAVLFVGAACFAGVVLAVRVAPGAAVGVAVVAITAATASVMLRFLAGSFRPAELDLTAIDPDPSR